MSRVTKSTGNVPVPQNKDEANAFIAQIGEHQRARQQIEIAMNEAMAPIKRHHEERAAVHAEEITKRTEGLMRWCDANRQDLTKGKTKAVSMAAGEIFWRLRPPKVTVHGKDAVIETFERMGLKGFLRTKKEIDKEAILREPDKVAAIQGVSVGSEGEDFGVKPFATELEELLK